MRITTCMNKKPTGLEEFVDRHRADFDAFEPRPDLWDSIEEELDAPAGTVEQPTLRLIPAPEEPASIVPMAWHRGSGRYGLAAVLVLLVLAGVGYSSRFGTSAASIPWKKATLGQWAMKDQLSQPASEQQALHLYTGRSPVAMTTAAVDSPRQDIARVVQRMESYYASQIIERQSELVQLEKQTNTAAPAEWHRELASLDSTYHELKVELTRNPDPNMVLDAMNRNLQIRLDILNQQLRMREQMNDYHDAPTLYADNR